MSIPMDEGSVHKWVFKCTLQSFCDEKLNYYKSCQNSSHHQCGITMHFNKLSEKNQKHCREKSYNNLVALVWTPFYNQGCECAQSEPITFNVFNNLMFKSITPTPESTKNSISQNTLRHPGLRILDYVSELLFADRLTLCLFRFFHFGFVCQFLKTNSKLQLHPSPTLLHDK